ncbi:hypothetical protein PK28_16415 [Hymenobacter sp. DG25B]|uniref:energy transducer TonB n=1 Tax=Hymenobacter sp. DG25B TaxID=1385664 RepID=UPI000541076E|nr:energy transducer TonB [Hymenobacter sp. DG25B]AIZ64860.1 hypothetical protein PK28_16415 [Hymenobacter sp. DG25B]
MRILSGAGLLALTLLPLLSQAQETKKVIKYHQFPENPQYREEYFVLKDDNTIRHGEYQEIYLRTEMPSLAGYYNQGRKDSIWHQYYNGPDQKVEAKGRYHNDKPVGVWEFYTYQGKLEQQYDYTRHQLVMNDPAETKITFRPVVGAAPLELNPVYIGGFSKLHQLIGQSLRFPPQALRNRKGGRAVVGFTLAADGQPGNFRVVQSVGYGIDEEALRVAQAVAVGWLPASVGGRPVAAEVEIPFEFQIR